MMFHFLLPGEAAEADVIGAANFRETTLKMLLETYAPRDIFNADESGIYFRALPNSTYVDEWGKKYQKGFKTAKDRVTLLITCNMAGEKEDLSLIGKSKAPRCFKDIKTLPLSYEFSQNAWMTGNIFERCVNSNCFHLLFCEMFFFLFKVRAWDLRLTKEERNVALLIDNCSAHKSVEGLKNIALHFLPPNTTSVLQPFDMGIIRTLKAYFRHEVCQKIIEVIDDENVDLPAQEVAKKISLLDAMGMINSAWKKITSKTILNCWAKAGITLADYCEEDAKADEDDFPPPPEGLSVVQFEQWINIDAEWTVAPQIGVEEKIEELVKSIVDGHESSEVVEMREEREEEEEVEEMQVK